MSDSDRSDLLSQVRYHSASVGAVANELNAIAFGPGLKTAGDIERLSEIAHGHINRLVELARSAIGDDTTNAELAQLRRIFGGGQ